MTTSQVLIVSFHAPPENSSAAGRIQCLLDHLPEMGWQPTVLTTETEEPLDDEYTECLVQTPYPGNANDILRQRLPFLNDEYTPVESPHVVQNNEESYRLHKRISKKVLVSVKSLILDTVAYPDPKRFWTDDAVEQGRELLKNNEYDLLVSTSPPATSHLIGNQLANEFQIPWVADFQDLWTQYHYNTTNPIRDYFESRLQKRVIEDAVHLTAATQPFTDKLRSFHDKPATPIYLGFEEIETRTVTDEFTITYTGSLYDGKRDPTKLFEAIDKLESSPNIDPSDIVIQFFGVQAPWLRGLVDKYNLDSTVRQIEWLPKDEILKKQKESQILLSIQWDHPMERMVCPGKIFEYLAAQRPILAYGGPTDGVVSSILKETNAGIKLNTATAISEYLENRYQEFKSTGKVPYHGDQQAISSYHHKEMARKFTTVFDSVI